MIVMICSDRKGNCLHSFTASLQQFVTGVLQNTVRVRSNREEMVSSQNSDNVTHLALQEYPNKLHLQSRDKLKHSISLMLFFLFFFFFSPDCCEKEDNKNSFQHFLLRQIGQVCVAYILRLRYFLQ